MSDSFIPFSQHRPAAAREEPFRLKILAKAQQTRPFQPLPDDAPSPADRPEEPRHAHEPKVTLHHEGDRVTRIEVQCSCGQRFELDCVY
jgi:hypothetical protein